MDHQEDLLLVNIAMFHQTGYYKSTNDIKPVISRGRPSVETFTI
jgi:hypothetical protein